ncbi:MAG: NAD(P)/FAD-dependent oxidoreductase [Thermomicrobiales bacterium]
MTADVIVVGAGVVGCSIAYRLAQSGRQVLVIDKRGIASGASGRNNGSTGAGSAMHSAEGRAIYALTSANLAMLRELPDELDADFELRLPGAVDLATTEAQVEHLRRSIALQRAAGLDVHWLDGQETRALLPAVSDAILGAEFKAGVGHLWPFALVHGLANAARRHGATFRTWTAVQCLHRRGDRVAGVVLAGGDVIEADDVILATNAYTPQLLDLPPGALVPARGQILVTQPIPPLIPYSFGTNFDKEYGRQTPGGQVLCGGYRRLDDDEGLGHYEERVNPAVIAGIAGCLTTLFPALRGVKVVRAWAGIMGFTADGLPLIGRYESEPGLTLAAGFNGGGLSWAAIVGQVIADLVNGRPPGFDLAPFDPNRFSGTGASWTNPFTAGERSDAGLALPTGSV